MFVCQPAVQESTAGTGVLMQQKKSAETLEIFRNNMNLNILIFFWQNKREYYYSYCTLLSEPTYIWMIQ